MRAFGAGCTPEVRPLFISEQVDAIQCFLDGMTRRLGGVRCSVSIAQPATPTLSDGQSRTLRMGTFTHRARPSFVSTLTKSFHRLSGSFDKLDTRRMKIDPDGKSAFKLLMTNQHAGIP